MQRYFQYIMLGTTVFGTISQLITLFRMPIVPSADMVWMAIHPSIIAAESAFAPLDIPDTAVKKIVDAAVQIVEDSRKELL